MESEKQKSGFSLIELIVVIAIMAVLLAVLAPALIHYVEDSRVQRDDSAMSEVVQGAKLSLADPLCYDELLEYSYAGNYSSYTDSSGVYGQKFTNSEYWHPDGNGKTVTITFNPDDNGDYPVATARVNEMPNGENQTKKVCDVQNMGAGKFYAKLKSTVGDTIEGTSAAYKHSSYTVFVNFSTSAVKVTGSWNGTNLEPDSPVAPTPPARESEVQNPSEGTTTPSKPSGGGTSTPGGGNSNPDGGGGTSTGGNTHTHSYSEKVTKQATCTETGVKKEVCSCGATRNETTIPALGHNMKVTTKEPTCTEAGSIEEKCTRCNEGNSTSKPALGHNYSATTITTAATCTTDGIATKVCSRCGNKQTDTIQKLGHDYVTDSKAATCNEEGYTQKKCKRCGNTTDKTTIGKTNHQMSVESSIAATCTEKGTVVYKCSLCGYSFTESKNALGHDFKEQITAATCTTNGYSIKKCSRCNQTTTPTTIPATGHQYVTTSSTVTCTKSGVEIKTCPVCGNTTTSNLKALGHNIVKTQTLPTATSIGHIIRECTRGDLYEDTPLDFYINYPEDWGIDEYPDEGQATFVKNNVETTLTWSELKAGKMKSDFRYNPSKITDTSINAGAFSNNAYLTSIILPTTITQIGDNGTSGCFNSCTNLKTVINNHGLSSIGNYAFNSCTSLTRLSTPTTTTYIGNYAFYKAGTKLPAGTFTSINFYNGLEYIGSYALSESYIKNISIPGSCTQLGENLLKNCSMLETFEIQEFDGDEENVLTTIPQKTCINLPKLREIILPTNISNIEAYAFQNCPAMSELTIPGTVKTIGKYAFQSCTGLKKLIIQEGVTELGVYCFDRCSSLYSIKLPSTLKNIPDYCFELCTSLQTITIPEGVETIGREAFRSNSLLSVVTLPTSLKSVGVLVFRYVRKASSGNYFTVKYKGDKAAWDNITRQGIFYSVSDTLHSNEWGGEYSTPASGEFQLQVSDGTTYQLKY